MAGQGKDAAFSLDDEAFSSDHFRMFEFKVWYGAVRACGYIHVCCHLRAAAAALCMVPYACLKPVDLPGGPCAFQLAYQHCQRCVLTASPWSDCAQVKRCPQARPHDWTRCPFAHPGAWPARCCLKKPTLQPTQCRITSARISVLTLHASCRREGQAARPSEVSVQWHGLPGVPQGELQPLSCA